MMLFLIYDCIPLFILKQNFELLKKNGEKLRKNGN